MVPQAAMLRTGASVAGFEIVHVLDGESGLGTVYEATQGDPERNVALKVFPEELSDRPGFRRRFRDEMPRQAAVEHPRVLPIYQAGNSDHGLYLAMRLVRGPSLRDLIPSHGLDTRRVMGLLAPIAEALDAMHEKGLLHHDVKPEKILIAGGERGDAFLGGFGIGHQPVGAGGPGAGRREGAIHYLSPEEIRGETPSSRSEAYAFGAVLFEALTGTPPFRGRSERAVLDAHLHDPPPRASERRPDLAPELDRVLERALAKKPAERQASVGQIVQEAGEALAPRPSTSPSRARRRAGAVRRPRRLVAAGARVRAARPSAKGLARLPLRVVLGLVALAVLAVAAGWSLSGRVGEERGRAGEPVTAGPMTLAVPAGWERLERPPVVPGLRFLDAVALGPRGGNGRSGLVAGTVEEKGPVPASFLRRLSHPPAQADIVRLGGASAYRYQRLKPPRLDRELSLYLLPVSGSVATIACFAPPGGTAEFMADCERTAATLRLSGVEPAALGAKDAYSGALDKALRRLNTSRERLRARLGRARTAEGQGATCAALASAYETAVDALVSRSLSGPERRANSAIVAALERTSDAYGRMASAAVVGDRAEFATTGREVERLERAVRAEVEQLRSLGYAVAEPTAPVASAPPPS